MSTAPSRLLQRTDTELECGKCREMKPDEAFYRNRRAGNAARRHRDGTCRACRKAQRDLGDGRWTPTAGYVYALELSSGLVKVGFAREVNLRMRHHEAGAAMYGVAISRRWTSSLLADAKGVESRALRELTAQYAPFPDTAETFHELTFEDAVDVLQRIARKTRNPGSHETRGVRGSLPAASADRLAS